MFKILYKENLTENMSLLKINAPLIAQRALPGQFIIIIPDKNGERIPLTICDNDKKLGLITIVVQRIGCTSSKIMDKKVGESFYGVLGPLGKPSHIVNKKQKDLKDKKYIFVAGGLGVAPIYPQLKWLKEREGYVDVIIGAKNKESIILEDEIRELADNLYITTDDGSYGEKGLVTEKLEKLLLEDKNKYYKCVTIGPMIMMKYVVQVAKLYNLNTIVSMNTLMVDGTGMCGACRVKENGVTKFSCVDGPEFRGDGIDFDEALNRLTQYDCSRKEGGINEKS